MPELHLPAIPELLGNAVIVQKDVWNTLVQYISQMQKVINNQANTLELLGVRVSNVESANANLAKALLGGVYNET